MLLGEVVRLCAPLPGNTNFEREGGIAGVDISYASFR